MNEILKTAVESAKKTADMTTQKNAMKISLIKENEKLLKDVMDRLAEIADGCAEAIEQAGLEQVYYTLKGPAKSNSVGLDVFKGGWNLTYAGQTLRKNNDKLYYSPEDVREFAKIAGELFKELEKTVAVEIQNQTRTKLSLVEDDLLQMSLFNDTLKKALEA